MVIKDRFWVQTPNFFAFLLFACNSNSEANIGSIYGWGFPSPGIFEFINEYGIKNFVRRSQFLSTSYGKYFDLPPTLNNVSDIKQFLQND